MKYPNRTIKAEHGEIGTFTKIIPLTPIGVSYFPVSLSCQISCPETQESLI